MRYHLLITPLVLAACGCAATAEQPALTVQPLPQEVVDSVSPQPVSQAPAPPARRRPGRTGYAHKRDAAVVYTWETDRVYPVSVTPGKLTAIQFSRNERLSRQPISADPSVERWMVEMTQGATDFVTVRCLVPGTSTNLFVASTNHAYQIDLTCRSKGGMDQVRWNYPEEDESALAATALTPPSSYDPNRASRSFSVSPVGGPAPAWMPIAVHEAAGKTFLEFPPNLGPIKLAPALFDTSNGGVSAIPIRINGRFYEIDRDISIAELRLNGAVVQIKRQS